MRAVAIHRTATDAIAIFGIAGCIVAAAAWIAFIFRKLWGRGADS
jgi:hypothetical protein